MRGAAILLGALLAASQAAHAQCARLWAVAELAQLQTPAVELRGAHGIAARIPRDWLRALHTAGARIDAASGIAATLYLCDSRAPNAFAWRDGGMNVALTLGMRNLLGDDWHAYAALLGHESAHLAKEHGARRQQRGAGLAFGESMLKTMLSEGGAPPAVLGFDLLAVGADAIGASYSREEEFEADAAGMRYARCAGFAAEGALALQRKLSGASDFLSSHPSSAARLAALREEIARGVTCR